MSVDGTPMATYDIAREAETLIRCLAGVAHASVHAGPRGIEAIHVTATDDGAARAMPGLIRSALLAGLATPVVPARIHVRTTTRPDNPENRRDDPGPGPARSAPAHRFRLIERDLERASPDPGDTAATPGRPSPAGTVAADLATGDTAFDERSRLQQPRLVAVDLKRSGDGRILCTVSVACDTRVHRAEALAIDLPGAAAQAAAQATVRAIADAGLAGLELGGLREVEIAGHNYVLVALRRTDTWIRHRSGSALVIDSPERAAALATIAAASDIL